jgi:DegV family protein with EDD domain
MNKIMLVTDSCADLTQKNVQDMSIKVIPLSLEIEEKTYFHHPDERELKINHFYEMLRQKKIAKTSLINTQQFVTFFEDILKEGYDILYIGFSSALSGTYHSSTLAAEALKEAYPNQKILTVDSLCASSGQGLLVRLVHDFLKQEKTIEEAQAFANETKQSITHIFTVAELGTLKRGGRLSNAKAFIGTLLKLKPLLHVNEQGQLVALQRIRGRKSSLEAMVEITALKIKDSNTQSIIISHGDCLDEAHQVGEMLKSRIEVQDIIYDPIGPVIGAHSGPGTIAIFFLGNSR